MIEVELCRILSEDNHPYFPKFIELIKEEDKFTVVMECIIGSPLIKWILNRKDHLPLKREIEASRLFYKICGAVSHLHSKGIVHRDIKFDNILAIEPTREGEETEIKVIDFGLSIVLFPQ